MITQNGKKFDQKKLNARFIIQGMKPPSPYQHIDTLVIARKHFGFTSKKLAYMTEKLCKNYKKDGHKKFSGFDLWRECLAGNQEAWEEMEKYNRMDVLSLEELYYVLAPWDNTVEINTYHDEDDYYCTCGSTRFRREGYKHTKVGKYQRYKCKDCGTWRQGKTNLLTLDKRRKMLK